jgi:hypothetical protein
MHSSESQAFNSASVFTRGRGRNRISLTVPIWFSTCPFFHPSAGT